MTNNPEIEIPGEDIDRYTKGDLIGTGAYKQVFKAYDTVNGTECAWNVVPVIGLSTKERRKIFQEIMLLKVLQSEYIIGIRCSWTVKDKIIFITELLSSGTLREYFRKCKRISLSSVKKWCVQILRGIHYLHGKGIIHRDLKCDNIFMNGVSGEVKIGDLGLSVIKDHAKNKKLSVLGTTPFVAPELFEEGYSEKVDIYSFGMCVLELVTGKFPFSECTTEYQIIKNITSKPMILPQSLINLEREDLKEFITNCINENPKDRPACEVLMKSEFLELSEEDSKYFFNLQIIDEEEEEGKEKVLDFRGMYEKLAKNEKKNGNGKHKKKENNDSNNNNNDNDNVIVENGNENNNNNNNNNEKNEKEEDDDNDNIIKTTNGNNNSEISHNGDNNDNGDCTIEDISPIGRKDEGEVFGEKEILNLPGSFPINMSFNTESRIFQTTQRQICKVIVEKTIGVKNHLNVFLWIKNNNVEEEKKNLERIKENLENEKEGEIRISSEKNNGIEKNENGGNNNTNNNNNNENSNNHVVNTNIIDCNSGEETDLSNISPKSNEESPGEEKSDEKSFELMRNMSKKSCIKEIAFLFNVKSDTPEEISKELFHSCQDFINELSENDISFICNAIRESLSVIKMDEIFSNNNQIEDETIEEKIDKKAILKDEKSNSPEKNGKNGKPPPNFGDLVGAMEELLFEEDGEKKDGVKKRDDENEGEENEKEKKKDDKGNEVKLKKESENELEKKEIKNTEKVVVNSKNGENVISSHTVVNQNENNHEVNIKVEEERDNPVPKIEKIEDIKDEKNELKIKVRIENLNEKDKNSPN